jgi:DNA-binding MarR family transcriptional regulator
MCITSRLEADGYVKRSVEKNDRRSFRAASITRKGETLFEKAVATHHAEISKKLSGIHLDDIEKMATDLKHLSDKIKGAEG